MSILKVTNFNAENGTASFQIDSIGRVLPQSRVILPKVTTLTLPPAASGAVGDIFFNTTDLKVYLNKGTSYEILSSLIPVINLIDSAVFLGLRNYMTAQRARYRNASYFEYTLDGSPSVINDGGGDMYDGGNIVQLKDNSATTVGRIDYNVDNSLVSNVRYGGFGYQHPLINMATSGSTNRRFGWASTGNLGADGGGSFGTQRVYNTSTVNGCIVHSILFNKAYNAGDPSVNHLFVTLGHSAIGSSINEINVESTTNSTDSDVSQYETTSTNCVTFRILLCKNSGVVVNVPECQTIITNLTTDFKTHFGL